MKRPTTTPAPTTAIGRELHDFAQMLQDLAYNPRIDGDMILMHLFSAKAEQLKSDWLHAAQEINRQEQERLEQWRQRQQEQSS